MGFTQDELTRDGFLGGALHLWQPRKGYRAASDPVFLAASVAARPGARVLELGCGAGAAILCLGRRVEGLGLSGLELQPGYADLARRNAAANGIEARIIEGDLAEMPATLRQESFDHVIANPPYLEAGGGTPARDTGREAAFREATPLAIWADAAIRRLKPGGTLTFIQRSERLADLLAALDGRVGSIEVKPLVPRVGQPATRVLVVATKGGRGAFKLHSPLILHDAACHDGDRDSYSPEARAILRDGHPLIF
ncbi:MAG: methyltransferase domain-containing protein [Rhodobacteraceae bacterium]|nr:methyltransferase domain-containing protein [Paracoccaceae bacterium]